MVRAAHGGFGGFLGLEVASLGGQSVFDHVAPGDAAELAQYLIESGDKSLDTVSLPLPFRVDLIGGDGRVHAVDVIASGRDEGGEAWGWVATLVPAGCCSSTSTGSKRSTTSSATPSVTQCSSRRPSHRYRNR